MKEGDNFLIKYFSPNDLNQERSWYDNEFWFVSTLIEASKDLPVFDLDLKSISLGLLPWTINSVYDYIDHFIDIENCSLEQPVILFPNGVIVNGWHRIIKAIISNKHCIKAVRLLERPEADGCSKCN